jgi:membrane protein implicated in regulation of membrane protease activity
VLIVAFWGQFIVLAVIIIALAILVRRFIARRMKSDHVRK